MQESSLPNEIIRLLTRSGDVITVLSTGLGTTLQVGLAKAPGARGLSCRRSGRSIVSNADSPSVPYLFVQTIGLVFHCIRDATMPRKSLVGSSSRCLVARELILSRCGVTPTRRHRTIDPHACENPHPGGAESTENAASPFQAEPTQFRHSQQSGARYLRSLLHCGVVKRFSNDAF